MIKKHTIALGAAWIPAVLISSAVQAHEPESHKESFDDEILTVPQDQDFIDPFSLPIIEEEPEIIPPGETRFIPNGENVTVKCDPSVPNIIIDHDAETGTYVTCPEPEGQSNNDLFLGM